MVLLAPRLQPPLEARVSGLAMNVPWGLRLSWRIYSFYFRPLGSEGQALRPARLRLPAANVQLFLEHEFFLHDQNFFHDRDYQGISNLSRPNDPFDGTIHRNAFNFHFIAQQRLIDDLIAQLDALDNLHAAALDYALAD